MKIILRRMLLFLLVVFMVAMGSLPYNGYVSGILDSVKANARAHGVSVDADSYDIGFPLQLTMNKVGGFVATRYLPIVFFFEKVEVVPRILPYLWLTAKFDGVLHGYDWQIRGLLKKKLLSGQYTINVSATKVNLHTHQLLGQNGISGLLGFRFVGENCSAAESSYDTCDAKLDVTIDDGSFSPTGLAEMYLRTFGERFLAPIKNISLHLVLEKKRGRILLTKLLLRSSLGSVEANGAIILDEAAKYISIRTLDIINHVVLTDEGFDVFGDYFRLASGTQQQSSEKLLTWDVAISGNVKERLNINVASSH